MRPVAKDDCLAPGENWIEFSDEFFNAGNATVPHAWLLHINFGYPLLDEGAEFCYRALKIEPMSNHAPSAAYFREGADDKRAPRPLKAHTDDASVVAYIYPRASHRDKRTVVGIVNRKLELGVAIHYNTRQFPRCANWQHWGKHEYVAALEPSNGSVEGRNLDRENRVLDS